MLHVAYLASQFPEAHEWFIVREIQAIVRHPEVSLAIVSLKTSRDCILGDEAIRRGGPSRALPLRRPR